MKRISRAGLGGWAAVLALVSVSFVAQRAVAETGDTTWVHTWNQDFINWATAHEQTFVFPDTSLHSSKIVLFYTIGCPSAPGDCDPWDRLGYIRLRHATEADTVYHEIARIVTPYDITPSPRPGTCTWQIDVSDYEFLLHGDVTLNSYIESWIGGQRGWLVTVDFAFIQGEPEFIPYRIDNLWESYYAVYGDPDRPIENVFSERQVTIDPDADAAKVRMFVTGHGQGNTENCAEFCNHSHSLSANGHLVSHNLWRSDCNQNPCSPQGGTWIYARAGWCPGSAAPAWDVDVTPFVTPGAAASLDYNVQAYTNNCRPSPECVPGGACPDCNYNYTGHTEPIYAMNSHIVYYRRNAASEVETPVADTRLLEVGMNTPNPFHPPTRIHFSVRVPGDVSVAILDAGGRLVRELTARVESPGATWITWDGRDGSGREVPSGAYFYRIVTGSEAGTRSMLLVR